jgi:hypothetical protein
MISSCNEQSYVFISHHPIIKAYADGSQVTGDPQLFYVKRTKKVFQLRHLRKCKGLTFFASPLSRHRFHRIMAASSTRRSPQVSADIRRYLGSVSADLSGFVLCSELQSVKPSYNVSAISRLPYPVEYTTQNGAGSGDDLLQTDPAILALRTTASFW